MKDVRDTLDDRLDAALTMTFPASDPIAVSSVFTERLEPKEGPAVTFDINC